MEGSSMKVDLAPGWKTSLDYGPNWLFVKLHGPFGETADASGIADSITLMMQQDLVDRIVLELDELLQMPSDFIHELFELRERVDRQGGLLRLCGLCDEHWDALEERDFSRKFVPFRNREEAVEGFYRPNKPR
jgi:anti-anti-sigma regulatory factor